LTIGELRAFRRQVEHRFFGRLKCGDAGGVQRRAVFQVRAENQSVKFGRNFVMLRVRDGGMNGNRSARHLFDKLRLAPRLRVRTASFQLPNSRGQQPADAHPDDPIGDQVALQPFGIKSLPNRGRGLRLGLHEGIVAYIQNRRRSVTIFEMTNATVGGYRLGSVALFAAIHLAVFSVFLVPFHWSLVAWLLGSYFLRMFGVTAGYHRYFSHRSYQLSRIPQFIMGFLAQTSGQKGVLWWASHHRVHHRNSDKENDIHSPVRRGFFWSHVGWVISNDYDDYDEKLIGDFSKFPELRWLNRYHLVPIIVYGALILAIGGVGAFVWGFLLSTVLLYHGSFSINSLAHLFGTRRFETGDDSRNNWWLALIHSASIPSRTFAAASGM